MKKLWYVFLLLYDIVSTRNLDNKYIIHRWHKNISEIQTNKALPLILEFWDIGNNQKT